MFITNSELASALGVEAIDLTDGATWHLPGDGGAGVTVAISHDEDGALSVIASESAPGEESDAVAWLAGTPREDGYDLTGQDRSGESSNSDDPRSAAAAIRRQLRTIVASEGCRKVA
jgi:hypothetical protein